MNRLYIGSEDGDKTIYDVDIKETSINLYSCVFLRYKSDFLLKLKYSMCKYRSVTNMYM